MSASIREGKTSLQLPPTNKPVRVLQIFHNLGMGGAETWLIEMLRYWSQNHDVDCDIMLTSDVPGALDDAAKALGVRIFVVPYGRRRLLSFSSQFRYILRTGNYDAIHDHQDRASGWHFMFGYPYLPKVRITHIHNPSYQIVHNYGVSLTRRLTGWTGMKLIGFFATHVTATSNQVLEEYGFTSKRFRRKPRAAVHCAFDTRRFLGSTDQARQAICDELSIAKQSKLILFAGRMDYSSEISHPSNHKNSAFAVDVAMDCFDRLADAHIVFAGRLTDALPALRKRIESRGHSSRVHFLGVRSDIDTLMLASDVLFFPSRGEGLGMVAVEAQACGLSVLASTDVPNECVVCHDLVTFLSLDRPIQEWSTQLIQLLKSTRRDPTISNSMVERSPFSIHRCGKRLLNLYREGRL